jgi:fucose permease
MMSSDSLQPSATKRLLILLHAGFLSIGVITVFLGQVLPLLSARMSLNDLNAGYLFIAQFAGSLTGTLLYNQLIKKFGYLKMLFGGFCLLAFGCAGLNINSFWWCLVAIYVYGTGIGLTIPAINLLVAQIAGEKSSSALNTLNFFWGVGAILCKPFVDFFQSSNSILIPTILLSISCLLISAGVRLSNYQENFHEQENFSNAAKPIWTTMTAWLIAIFSFIHIGIESSVGGWLTTFETRLTQDAASGWLSAAFIFFLMMVLGRGIAPLLFKFLTENVVLLGSVMTMTAGITLILLTENSSFLIFGAGILGFGTSTLYPTNISRFTKIFGLQAIQNATPLFVFGTLGGAFITWLVGFASTIFDSLRTGFFVVLISCLLLIILQIILSTLRLK